MSTKTGFTDKTKKNIMIGAGVFFKNFVVGVDTYENAKAKIIGATQGGGEFKAIPSVHNIAIDGIPGKASDLAVLDEWEVSLTANFIETNIEAIKLALGACSASDNGTYNIVKGKNEIEAADYVENITYMGTVLGSDTPVLIQISNALSTTGLDLKPQDKGEGVVTVQFDGYYSTENTDEPPFVIYWPKTSGATMTVGEEEVTVDAGDAHAVIVNNAAGALTVSSSASSKATAVATADGRYVIITGVAAGTSNITVSDGTTSKTIAVTVE